MALEIELYTGKLKFKDIEFTFVFDKKELRLIPPKELKRDLHEEWFMRELKSGVYTWGNAPTIDDPILTGKCNENGHKIIFILQEGSSIGCYNSVLTLKVVAYIECKFDRQKIDRISFCGPEINYIYPVGQAFTYSINEKYWDNGIFSLKTNQFNDTTSEERVFFVEGKEVRVHFGIIREIKFGLGETPLKFEATMMFEFEATDDYTFIYGLYYIAKNFIQFLCYRRNILLSKVVLSAPYEGHKHEIFASLHILNDENFIMEEKPLKDRRLIQLEYLEGNEGRILEDIASKKIYMRHLPDSYNSGTSINEARFVMITAAFEWEFKKLFPNGIKKKVKKIEAEQIVEIEIQKLIDENKGEVRKIYKFLRNLIKSDSLESKINYVGKNLSDIIDLFGNHLYELNGEKLKYQEMGMRLSTQRNNFAHGNLDREFVGNSLLDLLFLEIVVYVMQLKRYDITKYSIQMAINELFHKNLVVHKDGEEN